MMEPLISSLKVALASVFALYIKTHGYHWNVEGSDFPQLHAFFGEQYEEIYESIDPLAEHIRALDAYAPMAMERFIELSRVKSELGRKSSTEMVAQLLTDHEIVIAVLATAAKEAQARNKQGLLNFLAARIEQHEKYRWQLRATSKKI